MVGNDRNAASAQDDIAATLGLGRARRGGILRRWKWPLILVILLAAGGTGYYWLGTNGAANGVRYVTDPASRGDITVIVTATGTVQPIQKVDISSELSGIVRSVAVDYNSRVKVGQVLAELDTDKLKATVENSRARVNAAKAHVAEAEATVAESSQALQRTQALANRQFSSSKDLDAARAAYHRAVASLASAKADVAAAQAQLRLDETNLKKSCICSPIDGVVLSRNVDPGQVVASSLQAPTLFTIAQDLRQMEVQVDVDEADVGKVHEGQQAVFTVDAYPDRKFHAKVRELRYGSEVVQGVVTYKAVLDTSNADLLLRPGMTATAEITVRQEKNVLTVSNEALRFTPTENQAPRDTRSLIRRLLPGMPHFRAPSRPETTGPERVIWVLHNGVAQPEKVTVDATDGRRTQIVSGAVKAGDPVIVDMVTAAN